jgi:hypothetical protein
VGELPRLSGGKIDRSACVRLLEQPASPGG